MHLKRLELSGFKSFAKRTVLEFPTQITAIVGPNGSGKSNCAEAIKWALGEQSMKTLRGKRGEDLIFSGTSGARQLSKASVTLVFDNTKKELPVEFDEVSLSRHVYRDGSNEYRINDSRVRLKDIIDLLGNIGIGASQHHIIGQGEADRILYASLKERKEMIEEALGLKVYHIKQEEAERKLSRTEENLRQVEALRKEIQPHLRFLRKQAEKFEKTKELRTELKQKYQRYIGHEERAIAENEQNITQRKERPESRAAELEKKRKQMEKEIAEKRKGSEEGGSSHEEHAMRDHLSSIRETKAKLEHDRGRIEGMIEAISTTSGTTSAETPVSYEEVEQLIAEVDAHLTDALAEEDTTSIHALITKVRDRLVSFMDGLQSGTSRAEKDDSQKRLRQLQEEKKQIEQALADITQKERDAMNKQEEASKRLHESEKALRTLERSFYELEKESNQIKDTLRSIAVEEDRLRMRKEELDRARKDMQHYFEDATVPAASRLLPEDEHKKVREDINRIKFKLEEAGGVDESVLQELEEIENRDQFFEKEIQDLQNAAEDLRNLSRELSEKLEKEFSSGIKKINQEFQVFFETIFGGGSAKLVLRAVEEREKHSDEDTNKKKNPQGGVDVNVNLPRKNIKGLNMLSGGERALTSIALLFALSSVNPPPFLVLDEMDAALDEHNSRRYGKMLEELSEDTQLIIVTHNRESMHHAGVLYGVTMGNDGVSKVLSIKIEEAEQYSK